MHHNRLSREVFNTLEETFQSKAKAEVFACTFEEFMDNLEEKTNSMTTDRLKNIRLQIKEDLSKTLVTRELFEERFSSLQSEMNAKFEIVNQRFNTFNQTFKSYDERFNAIDEKFNAVDEKFTTVDHRFNAMNIKLESLDFKLKIF